MQQSQPARMLRIHILESDRYQGKPLYEAIVAKCRELKIAGATVLRGVEGRHEQSITISIVDSFEKLNALMPVVEEMIDTGTMSLSDVQVVRVQKEGG